jgi:hypothetical protein
MVNPNTVLLVSVAAKAGALVWNRLVLEPAKTPLVSVITATDIILAWIDTKLNNRIDDAMNFLNIN